MNPLKRGSGDFSPDGVLGVSPKYSQVPQSMGDYQGVWILFPPFKGDSRGLTNTFNISQN